MLRTMITLLPHMMRNKITVGKRHTHARAHARKHASTRIHYPWNNKDKHINTVSVHPVFSIYVCFLVSLLITNFNEYKFYLFYIKSLV